MTSEQFEARNHKLRCDFADMEEYKKSFRYILQYMLAIICRY